MISLTRAYDRAEFDPDRPRQETLREYVGATSGLEVDKRRVGDFVRYVLPLRTNEENFERKVEIFLEALSMNAGIEIVHLPNHFKSR